MIEAMKLDKKGELGLPRLVILRGIGHVESYKGSYCTTIDEELLDEALGWMVAEFRK